MLHAFQLSNVPKFEYAFSCQENDDGIELEHYLSLSYSVPPFHFALFI